MKGKESERKIKRNRGKRKKKAKRKKRKEKDAIKDSVDQRSKVTVFLSSTR
jgi:hypothetical protein